jgi:hypothetical protein
VLLFLEYLLRTIKFHVVMNETYQDPGHEASYGGVDAIFRAVRGKVSKKEIKKWLEGVDAYTLHKPVRRKFPTNRVIVNSFDQQWQADLVDVSHLQNYNESYRYILTCIDILSKYAWAVPLKQKRGIDIVEAFKQIMCERRPKVLQTDQGKEFKNSIFQKFLKEKGIRFFTTFNETKASIIERFNRTLKTKMWKYFSSRNTYKYIDVLHQLVKSYNHTFHTSIKRAPVQVNSENERDVWFTLYRDNNPKISTKCVFNVGDVVRVSKKKLTFEKGYETNWTEELFIITECVKRQIPVYRISDLLGESILGTFYPQELQKVRLKEEYRIEKILKKRMRKKQIEYLVKYKGYPIKFNEWIPSSHLLSL